MNRAAILSTFIAIVVSILVINPSLNWWSKRDINGANLLIKNGVIYTSDTSLPFADSMAVKDGRIVGIGSYSSLQGFEGLETEVLNLDGKVVVPGFIDSHVHFLSAGMQVKVSRARDGGASLLVFPFASALKLDKIEICTFEASFHGSA